MSLGFPLFPQQASSVSGQVDAVTFALLAICGFILALVFGLIVLFGGLYRKGSPRSREMTTQGQRLLEWGWTLGTLFVFVGLFVWASILYFHMHVAPPDSTEITAVGKQWMWKFQHPGGKREIDELHVPIGRPVLLTLTSEDVIHSFFVPAFRVKQDVLPGRYEHVWFKPTRLGEFHLFCTQYCGTLHAGMRGSVVVMTEADYRNWLQAGISFKPSMPARGARLFTRLGCISCHGTSPEVAPGVRAPSLEGLFGSRVGLSDGSSVVADENYLRESIVNPRSKVVMGYDPIMPSFAGQVSEEELLDLIAYLKSLKERQK